MSPVSFDVMDTTVNNVYDYSLVLIGDIVNKPTNRIEAEDSEDTSIYFSKCEKGRNTRYLRYKDSGRLHCAMVSWK